MQSHESGNSAGLHVQFLLHKSSCQNPLMAESRLQPCSGSNAFLTFAIYLFI